ncbi:MAG: hypothetical protein ACRD41_03585, partial [Candidatus Acidiferrales bacterium]
MKQIGEAASNFWPCSEMEHFPRGFCLLARSRNASLSSMVSRSRLLSDISAAFLGAPWIGTHGSPASTDQPAGTV